MAQELDNGEFWLPSEFLTDDDLLTDFKTNNGFGFHSDLSSPVESVFGSNETESDEDDFINRLAWKMSNSSFLDSSFSPEYSTTKGQNQKQKLSSSPQSTLYGCKPESTRSSPNCVSSPTDSKDALRWDFLYAAAEEVARQRMIDETSIYGPTTHKLNQFYSNQAQAQAQAKAQAQAQARLSYQQLQFQLMRQQENIGYQFKNGMRNVGGTTAWPTLQQSQQMQPPRQRTGTGMRAVFLGETGTRKERTGTGVFLPRRFENNSTNVQKKPGCSVLLPEKVVHALNLNLDSIDSSSHTRDYRNVAADCGVGFHHQNNVKFGQQMKSSRPQQKQQPVVKQELGLPHEWTY